MRRKINNDNSVRIVMQATGMYCVAHSLFSLFTPVARIIAWRIAERPSGVTMETMKPVLLDSIVYGILLLIPAWFFLAKADWCARVVSDMSKPQGDEEQTEELVA